MSGASKILMGSGGVDLPSDDEFDNVSFLSHFDGSNNGVNNVFDDGSDENHSITASGTVTQGTFGPFSRVDGEWSNYIGPGAAYNLAAGLGAASHSDFTLDGAYTIEFFVNLTSTADQYFFGIGDTSSGDKTSLVLGLASGTSLGIGGGTVLVFSTGSELTVDTWQHVAVTRNGSNLVTCWVDGTALGTTFTVTDDPSGVAVVGTALYSTIYYSSVLGHMSNFRILKGTCLYTSNFTPPTAPLTAITNTKLLTCQSNRFIDNSASAHTLTAIQTPKVSAFTPILTSEVYASGTNGASTYFDQTSASYLTASDATDFDFGTGDYTVEMWAYPDAGFNTSWAMAFSTTGVNQYWAWTDGGGTESSAGLSVYNGTSGPISGSNADIPPIGAWSHIVFQNTSGTYNWYLNGRRVYNTAQAEGHSASATGVMIGRSANYSSSFFFGGYLSDVRVVTGSCAYTNAATLTVPTAPLTAVTNTKLLLNMADGQMIDSAAQNNMTLYGNADTSTTQQKFGTASLAVDGTGDYVTLPSTSFVPFGTGDFTVECWVYFDTVEYTGIWQADTTPLSGAGYIAPVLEVTPTGAGGAFVWSTMTKHGGDSRNSSSVTPSTSTWYHTAVVRTSGTIKVFVDGTQVVSDFTDTTDFTDRDSLVIGGFFSTDYLLDGYIDEFRISHVARYTSNFTPTTEAFPDKGQ